MPNALVPQLIFQLMGTQIKKKEKCNAVMVKGLGTLFAIQFISCLWNLKYRNKYEWESCMNENALRIKKFN